MTRRAPVWSVFARDVMPHLSPLLGPWLDELLQRGAPPPTVRWVIVCEGGELDGRGLGYVPVPAGTATRYTTEGGARKALAHCASHGYQPLQAAAKTARVMPELQIMGAW